MTAELNGAPVEINFGECSLEQLVESHNDMCVAAHDFGLTAEPVATFGSVQEGIAACERLHGQILKARERAAAPSKRERRRAAAEAKKATVKETVTTSPDAVVAGYTEPTRPKTKTKEKTVAKKTKKTKSAKKAKAPNGARKSSARLPGDTKIVWLADGNPAREGTIFYDRVEKIRKAKTVDAALKVGGTGADARECVKRKWAKFEGGTRA